MKIHMLNSEGIKYKNYCIIYSPSFTTVMKKYKMVQKDCLTDKMHITL